jgi:transketolase
MAMKNPRQVYGETLVLLGKENKDIVVLEADLGKSTMSHLFQLAYPNRYFEIGIAEQNMTSFAAGLVLTGKIAFTNSFAVFAAGRAYDQIRQGICTAGLNVKIHGSSSGLSDFGDGATHQAIDDIAIMRAIPNMTVLVPMDSVETKKIIMAAAAHNGPVYIRTGRNEIEDEFPENEEFVIGKPYLLREGNDIAVFACGVMVSKALEAANMLENEGISVRVINVSSLKPIDEFSIKYLAKGVKGIITAEEHSVIGGLTSAITYIMRGNATPIEPIAIMDVFGQSGQNHEELLEHYKLTITDIMNKCRELNKSK